MKQAVYEGIHDIEIEEVEKPTTTANDIIVKVMRNGICGSDLHTYNNGGDDIGFYKGDVMGHEFVGEVVEVGDHVKNISVGDHVFINPSNDKINHGRKEPAGGLSQYDLIQNAKLNWNVFKLSPQLSWDRGVVLEPYSVGIHAKNMANPQPSKNYVVLGAGPVGLAAASGLIEQGCQNVVIVDIAEKRLQFAHDKLGLATVNPNNSDLYHVLADRFGTSLGFVGDERVNVDAFIDATGVPQYMNDFTRQAKMGAKFVVVALGSHKVAFTPQNLAMNQLQILGSVIYTPDDILEAIHDVEDQTNNFPDIVSIHYPLTQAADAFERASNDKDLVKVVIDVNQ